MSHVLNNDEFVEVTPVCNLLGQYTFNVLNFLAHTKVGNSVTDTMVAAQLNTLLSPIYKSLLTTNTQYWGLKAQVIAPVRFDAEVDTSTRGNGAVVGELLPTQTAGVISLRTGLASKSAQGRMYFPAASELDNQASATPSGAYLAAIAGVPTALIGNIVVANGADSIQLRWSIRSRKLNTMFPITNFIVRSNWGTIRRRSHIGHADVAPF